MFKPQLVLDINKELAKKTTKVHSKTFIVSEKLDGWYVYITYDPITGFNVPCSRAGRLIPSLTFLQQVLNSLHIPVKESFVLIGEAIIPNTPFHILNGTLNKSKGNCDCTDVHIVLHDMLRSSNLCANSRYINLTNFYEAFLRNSMYFGLLPVLATMRFNLNELYKVFDKIVNSGGEGIVCKNVDSSYEFGKRNGNLLKLKAEVEKDLLCIAVEYSIGEMGNSGLSLILTDNNDVRCKVVINSLQLITSINIDSNFVVGKVVNVKAMEELSNGVLRQPTFNHIRDDVTRFEYCV